MNDVEDIQLRSMAFPVTDVQMLWHMDGKSKIDGWQQEKYDEKTG